MKKISRRDALRLAGGLGIVAAPLLLAWRGTRGAMAPKEGVLGAVERANTSVEKFLYSGAEVSYDALTPGMGWPSYHVAPGDGPPIQPPGWRLKIGGMVDRPLSLTLDELMAMEKTTLRLEHHCVEGWSAVADWTGVRVAELAKRAGARETDYVEFRSFDGPPDERGYWSSWDRESAVHAQTLVAFGMNGKPLSPAHGAPVRLYGASKLGYKQVKHLTEINFLDRETGGYWENRGYEWFGGT